MIDRFRKFLRDQLRKDGWKVNMVGSKSEGTMADNVRQMMIDLFLSLFTMWETRD